MCLLGDEDFPATKGVYNKTGLDSKVKKNVIAVFL